MSITGNFKKRFNWLFDGLSLPSFDANDGSGTTFLQWLFSSSKMKTEVKTDGFTYVKDSANKGTDRLQLEGVKAIFDGVDGVVTIPHSDSLTFGNGTVNQPFSIAAWVNMTDATDFEVVVKDSATTEEYIFRTTNTDLLALLLCDGTVSNRIGRVTTALTAFEGQDLFVIATSDGGVSSSGIGLHVYDDSGSLLLSDSGDSNGGTYVAMDGNASTTQKIGNREIGSQYANGDIYAVKVFNAVLTSEQIDLLVANPNTILGTEVGKWNLDEGAGLTAFDSVDGDNMAPTYESDFSSGVDSWNFLNGTITGNNDGIGGRDDCLKFINTGTTNLRTIYNDNEVIKGRNQVFTYDVYIPSTNAECDGFDFEDNGVLVASHRNLALDTWHSFEDTRIPASLVFLEMRDGDSSTLPTIGGNEIYVRNAKVTPVIEEGKHGTISGGVTWGTQDVVSFQNYEGYSEGIFYTTSEGVEALPTIVLDRSVADVTIEAIVRHNDAGGGSSYMGVSKSATAHSLGYYGGIGSNEQWVIAKNVVTVIDTGSAFEFSQNTFYKIKLIIKTNNDIELYIDDVLITTETDSDYTDFDYVVFQSNIGGAISHIKVDGVSYSPLLISGSSGEVKIPAQTSTLDVFGEALTYSGKAPKDGRLVESHCGTLNGVDEYIDTGVAFSPSGDYEISGWFNSAPTALIGIIFDGRDASNDGIVIYQTPTNSKLTIIHNSTTVTATTAYDDGEWHRFIIGRSGSTISVAIYNIAGELEETIITGTDATAIVTTNSVSIASNYLATADYFAGQLANIKAVDAGKTVFHYPLAEGAGLISYNVADATEEATPVYESDFSSGIDGWLTSNVSISSVDSSLKIVLTEGLNLHRVYNNGFVVVGVNYNFSFDVKIPSTNIMTDSVVIHTGSTEIISESLVPDVWTTVSVEAVAAASYLRVYASDGGNITYSADGEIMYLRNISYTPVVEVGGNGTIVATEVDFWANTQDIYHYNLLEGFSDSALSEVLANMNTAELTTIEQSALTNFVLAEEADDNFDKYDEFYAFGLSGSNALRGFKGKVGKAFGSPTLDIEGLHTNGSTQYVNTNWNFSTDAVNYKQDDALFGLYLNEWLSPRDAHIRLMGANETGATAQAVYYNTNANGRRVYVNNNINSGSTGTFKSGTLNIASRQLASTQQDFENGELFHNGAGRTSVAVPNLPAFIGGMNQNGGLNSAFEGIISTAIFGSSIGFDQAAHYLNHLEFLIELGTFAQPVIDRFTGLSEVQDTAIRNFVNQEVRDSNWGLYDEFFCFALGETNSLIGFKSKTATNNGATFDVNGATTNGIDQWIDTNYAPSTDSINRTLDNATLGVFVKVNNAAAATQTIAGSIVGSDSSVIMTTASGTRYNQNAATFDNAPQVAATGLQVGARTGAAVENFYFDGVSTDNNTNSSTALIATTIAVGGRKSGAAPSLWFDGTVSTFQVGAAIGFSQSAHNTNLRAMLTELGTI